jgi:parvulin-like peptidyl-prolyl isomerase
MKKKIEQLKESRLAKREEKQSQAIPRITNHNVAEHREDMLSGARKYIYPLQQSKHKIVLISTGLFLTVVIVFSILCVLFLYRFQTTSGFMYQVTRVISFPIARSGSTFIAYENYLFELGHYIHYYENQQQLSFETEAGQAQLNSYKQRALDKVINDAYIKKIAKEQGISVNSAEVDEQIRIAREQNRLGSNDEVFEDVLRDFWNWSIDDFRRSLKAEILEQKVLRALDTETSAKATEVYARLTAGEDFAELAAEYSEDISTKEAGGEFGFVNKSNRNVSQQTVDTLFSLGEGQTSGVTTVPYGTGYALAIVKNLEKQEDQSRGAYIIFQLQDIDTLLNDQKEKQPYRLYLDPVGPPANEDNIDSSQ